MTEHFIDINKYNEAEVIGRGGFGIVYKIQDKKTKEIFAAKVAQFELIECTKEDIISITREVNNLNKIAHGAIIEFIGYSPVWFEGIKQPVIITEYCKNGNLLDIIDLERRSLSHESWDDTKKLINIYGIAAGMSYLHSKDIIHRDLKPGNILMDDRLFPKIADFGLSKICTQDSYTTGLNSTAGVKGTIPYIAPEIFKSNEYSKSSDVYAYGFIVYEIMTNKQPYKGLNQFQIMEKVTNDHERPKFEIPIPPSYRQLIEQCWSQDPRDRPTFSEIVELLKSEDFITDKTSEDDFYVYVNYLDEFNVHKEFKGGEKILHIHDYIQTQTTTFRNVTVHKDGIVYDEQNPNTKFSPIDKKKMIYPANEFENLDETCQLLVRSAVKDVDACIRVGLNLIENKENFPQNTQLGIKYLKSAKNQGSIDASYILSELYYKGEYIPQDLAKSRKYIKKYIKGGRMDIVVLYCKINKKEGNYGECIKYLRKACKNGCGLAIYIYGKLLYKGEGTTKDVKSAIKYFKMAQKNGIRKALKYLNEEEEEESFSDTESSKVPKSPESEPKEELKPKPKSKPDEMNELGESYLNGKSKNLKEAARLFKEASNAGHIRASYNLGMCYLKEQGVPIDLYESARLFRIASDGGDTDAMNELACLYYNGLGVIENKKESFKLWRQGYKKGNLECLHRYAHCFYKGDGVKKDYKKAARLYKIGAQKNYMPCINFLGFMHYLGHGVPKDLNEYHRLTNISYKKGYSTSIKNTGIDYIEGSFYEKDVKYGIGLLKQAAEIQDKGGILACRNLTKKYYKSEDIEKDIDKAMHYYRLAASYNDIQVINEIDVEFPTNIVKGENVNTALNDILIGHEKGNLYFTVSLGMCYEYGEGVHKNLNKAYELYEEAFNRGSQRAIYRLGLFYEKGIIVDRDLKEAVRLYKISSD